MKRFSWIVLLLVPAAWSETIMFSLDTPIQISAPGALLTFTGSILNQGNDTLYLNGAYASLPYFELSVDYTAFFSVVPPTLLPGGSYNGPIFGVAVSQVAAPGDYFGSFILQGGLDAFASDDLATQNFQVSVSSVPEPSTLPLLATGLMLLAGATGLRRWRTSPIVNTASIRAAC